MRWRMFTRLTVAITLQCMWVNSSCCPPETRSVRYVRVFSRFRLFATLWTVAHQAPLSMGFSRQEHWSGLPFLLQGISLPQRSNPQTQHLLHYWQILYRWATREAQYVHYTSIKLEETNNLFFLPVFVLFQKANVFIYSKTYKKRLFLQ